MTHHLLFINDTQDTQRDMGAIYQKVHNLIISMAQRDMIFEIVILMQGGITHAYNSMGFYMKDHEEYKGRHDDSNLGKLLDQIKEDLTREPCTPALTPCLYGYIGPDNTWTQSYDWCQVSGQIREQVIQEYLVIKRPRILGKNPEFHEVIL